MAELPAPTDIDDPIVARLTTAEEHVARGIVAGYRARLDWMLRVPEWSELYAEGLAMLELPGQRQGIGQQAAILALPLEHKHQLVRRVLETCRHHVRSSVGRHICRLLGLELFDRLELDELLTVRQWQRLREAAVFRLGQEHRRYKHAQQLLFSGHHNLVEYVVRQSVFRPEHRADCLQEGALGLLAAIDRVDDSGNSFTAYAASWIRRHVRNYLLRQRLPVHAPVNLISEAIATRDRDDGTDSVAAAATNPKGLPHRLRVQLLECLRHPTVALDEPLADGSDATVTEMLVDTTAESPAEATARAELVSLVESSLGALTHKQRHVLRYRFGLDGQTARSLSDIARGAGISHQQAGMRERRALQRLESVLAPLAAEWYGSV